MRLRFHAINGALSDETCARLKHLYQEYIDATGPGGSSHYLIGWGQDHYGDEDISTSTLQEEYPNAEHGEHILHIVERCPNLESLGLVGTHHLHGDLMVWSPASGKGLKSLFLQLVYIAPDNLIGLMSSPSFSEASSPAPSPLYSSC